MEETPILIPEFFGSWVDTIELGAQFGKSLEKSDTWRQKTRRENFL